MTYRRLPAHCDAPLLQNLGPPVWSEHWPACKKVCLQGDYCSDLDPQRLSRADERACRDGFCDEILSLERLHAMRKRHAQEMKEASDEVPDEHSSRRSSGAADTQKL